MLLSLMDNFYTLIIQLNSIAELKNISYKYSEFQTLWIKNAEDIQ